MSNDRKKQISQTVRLDVWKTRFGNNVSSRQCPCCNLNTLTLKNFECGCIISVVNGGFIQQDNLIPICKSCNKSIGFYNIGDYMVLSGLDWKKIKQTFREFCSRDIIDIRCKIMNTGWMCCFSNPVLEGIYWVGYTFNDPDDEIKIISKHYPYPFKIEFTKKVDDCEKKHHIINSIFEKQYINNNTNFVRAELIRLNQFSS